jgi:hypothetical protein
VQTISDGLRSRGAVSLCLLLTAGPLMPAQTGNGVSLQIKADQITAKMPPTFHGLMTEEINYAFEGGLYAELIRNRNFKETVPARQNRQNPHQSRAAKEVKDLVNWSLVAGARRRGIDGTRHCHPSEQSRSGQFEADRLAGFQ